MKADLNEQEQAYEELVNFFIDQEVGYISWDRIDEIEETAGKIIDLGFTVSTWKALNPEQQAEALKRQP